MYNIFKMLKVVQFIFVWNKLKEDSLTLRYYAPVTEYTQVGCKYGLRKTRSPLPHLLREEDWSSDWTEGFSLYDHPWIWNSDFYEFSIFEGDSSQIVFNFILTRSNIDAMIEALA